MSPSDRDAGHADRREVIAIPAPGKMPYLTLGGLLSIAPIAIAIASLGGFSSEIPVERLPAVLGLVLLIEVPIAVLLIWLSTRRRVEIVGGHLEILAAFYRRRAPLGDLDLDRARVVDLREKRELRPRLKTNGFGLPGFAAGHFRDATGRKLFCLVTQPRNVLIPIADGSALLLSAARPGDALDRLRRRIPADRRA